MWKMFKRLEYIKSILFTATLLPLFNDALRSLQCAVYISRHRRLGKRVVSEADGLMQPALRTLGNERAWDGTHASA
jgi:hypothetical protein